MNWVLMGIGYIIVDISVWDLPTLNYIAVQLGCIFLYVAGSFANH
jgi:hypothetical protein